MPPIDTVPQQPTAPSSEKLYFGTEQRSFIDRYLSPGHVPFSQAQRPWVTVTYACSLDSQISLKPGAPTVLSGPASKSMTHYLRTKHDAILVGSGTAIADDPGLNSRLSDAVDAGLSLQPKPVVLDRRARWCVNANSKVIKLAREGKGRGPIIAVGQDELSRVPQNRRDAVERCGGEYIASVDFRHLLQSLAQKGIRSLMIEGGGQIINGLLSNHPELIDAVIVTIAPVYLGQGGVMICPEKEQERVSRAAVRFRNVRWLPLDADVVMCANIGRDERD